jgi:hypothetical protein
VLLFSVISFNAGGERVIPQQVASPSIVFRSLADELKITEKEMNSLIGNHERCAKRFSMPK